MFRLLARLATAALAPAAVDQATTLVVYTTHGPAVTAPAVERMRAEHPEIAVELVRIPSRTWLERLRREREAPRASVVWGGEDFTFEVAAREGLLAPSAPSWAAGLAADQRDAAGRWLAQFLEPVAVAYRRGASDLPERLANLADPDFRNRLVLPSVETAPFMRFFYGAMIAPRLEPDGNPRRGFEWIERLLANRAGVKAADLRAALKVVAASADPKIADVSVGLASEIDGIRAEDSLAIDFVVPLSAPAYFDGVAKVAGAPHGEAADALLERIGAPDLAPEYVRRGRIPLPAERLRALTIPSWMSDAIAQTRFVSRDLLIEKLPAWTKALEETGGIEDLAPKPEGLGSIALDALDVIGTLAVAAVVVVLLRRQRRAVAR